MVLGHIQAAANEGQHVSTTASSYPCTSLCSPIILNSGIWTKHIKAKTELHQTIIDRCLKSLVQKQLVKAVKSVKVSRYDFYLFKYTSSQERSSNATQ
jgi:hypothetical protein